jgi:hypothetical protein
MRAPELMFVAAAEAAATKTTTATVNGLRANRVQGSGSPLFRRIV